MAARTWAVFTRSALTRFGSLHFASGHTTRESARAKAARLVTEQGVGHHRTTHARVVWDGRHKGEGPDPRTDAEREADEFTREGCKR